MIDKNELTGLAVCGGTSSRMGQDKSLLCYHGETQREHVAKMLSLHCAEVYLSLNEYQQPESEQYPVITDLASFQNNGPIAATLSAFQSYPGSNFVVVGCDYPLLSADELENFILSIDDLSKPAAFFNSNDGFYEPLLAYYPAAVADFLLAQFNDGNQSLQNILKMLNCKKYFPLDENCIKSIDDPEACRLVLEQLKG